MKEILKSIYSAIPFKRELFGLFRNFNLPESIYKHLYFKGSFKVKINGSSFRIQHHGYQVENDLFWKGLSHWESSSLKLWAKLAETSDVIFDVGANTGVYSLLAGAVNNKAKVFAFEPLDDVFNYLGHNISLNHFDIKAFKIAASNQNGTTSFYTDSEFSYVGSLNQAHHIENTKKKTVQCQTLDSFISKENIYPALVKIDVERHEPEVIEGFIQCVKAHHPTMLIEVLDESIGDRIRLLLQGTSYLFFSVNDKTKEVKPMKRMGKSEDFNVLVITENMARKIGLIN